MYDSDDSSDDETALKRYMGVVPYKRRKKRRMTTSHEPFKKEITPFDTTDDDEIFKDEELLSKTISTPRNLYEKYFFYKTSHPFSQFYSALFVVNGIIFKAAEYYMMYCKAMLFKDYKAADEILKASSPAKAKKLGRKIKNFDENVWTEKSRKFVIDGNYHKFSQNPSCKETLVNSGACLLAEASFNDVIWGIGWSENDVLADNKEHWRGTNWLGECLMLVRARFNLENLNSHSRLYYVHHLSNYYRDMLEDTQTDHAFMKSKTIYKNKKLVGWSPLLESICKPRSEPKEKKASESEFEFDTDTDSDCKYSARNTNKIIHKHVTQSSTKRRKTKNVESDLDEIDLFKTEEADDSIDTVFAHVSKEEYVTVTDTGTQTDSTFDF